MNSASLCFSSLCALLWLTGCKPVSPASDAAGLVYCAEGSPESFNPQLVTSGTTIDAISQHLYDRLLDIDALSGALKPALAQSWQVSPDGLVYRFKLRHDVTFHQTAYFTPSRALNAEDVVFTFNRMLLIEHPFFQTATEYPYFDSIDWRQRVLSVSAVSADEVEFKLSQPDSSFLSVLATDFAAILSAEYGELLARQDEKPLLDIMPIGTGPFKFREYQKDVLIRYYRHPTYWRAHGPLAQLVIDIVPDNTKRLAKLLTRECDVAPIPRLAELQMLTTRADFSVDQQTSMNVGFWAFNTQKPPFNQVKVRQALALAINKPNILQAVYFGQAEEATSVLPPNSWAYLADSSRRSFNPQQARQLLAEAGYPNGFSLDIWAMPVQRMYNPNAQKMAELIQADLSAIGVRARIVSYEWNTFRRKLGQGEHDTVLIGWSADNADPDNFMRPLLSCAAAVSGSNRANWCDEHFDEFIASALRTTEIPQRRSYYFAAQQYLQEQMPLVPIAHSKRFQVRNSAVQGVSINPYGGISFVHAEKTP
jgi:cationic peptide transport system substrate-binding protein